MANSSVLAELLEIGEVLGRGEESDWDVRNKAMVKLQELAVLASTNEAFLPGLEKIKKHLASQVVKEVCTTVSVLAQHLGEDFDPYVAFFFSPLLRLVGVKTLVMSQSAHEALTKVVEHVSPAAAVDAVLAHATSAKVPKERARCMEYLSLLLDRSSTDSLERYREAIASAVVTGMSDAAPETRALARGCFFKFAGHWEERASSLKENLDSSIQRALSRDAQAATTKKKSAPLAVSHPKRRAGLKRDQTDGGPRARVQNISQRVSVTSETSGDDVAIVQMPAEHRQPTRLLIVNESAKEQRPSSTTTALRIPIEREESTVPPAVSAERKPAAVSALPQKSMMAHNGSTSVPESTMPRATSDAAVSDLGPTTPSVMKKAKRVRLNRLTPSFAAQPPAGLMSTPSAVHHSARTAPRGLSSTPPAKRMAHATDSGSDWDRHDFADGSVTAPIPKGFFMPVKRDTSLQLAATEASVASILSSSPEQLSATSQPADEGVLCPAGMQSANADGQAMMECQTVSESTPAQEEITDASTTLSENAMCISQDQRTHQDDETSHSEETAKIQYAALEALLHLPSEPVAGAVALARSRVAAGAPDSLESTLHAIMAAFTHHRPLAARRALAAMKPLIGQPKLAMSAIRWLTDCPNDRQYALFILFQLLLLLPDASPEETKSELRSLIAPVISQDMVSVSVEVRKAATDVAAALIQVVGGSTTWPEPFLQLPRLSQTMLKHQYRDLHASGLARMAEPVM